MIEKLVVMIRASNKSSESLALADMLEKHGNEITEEIVGAALCRMLGLDRPPNDVRMAGFGHEGEKRFGVISVTFWVNYPDICPSDVTRLYESVGRMVYGDDGSHIKKNWKG